MRHLGEKTIKIFNNYGFYLVCISQINNSVVQIKTKNHSYKKSKTQGKENNRTNLEQVSHHAVI